MVFQQCEKWHTIGPPPKRPCREQQEIEHPMMKVTVGQDGTWWWEGGMGWVGHGDGGREWHSEWVLLLQTAANTLPFSLQTCTN